MWYGCPSILAAVLTAIALPAPEAADDGQATITIIGSPSLIPEGSRCEITLNPVPNRRETVETIHKGTVLRSSEEEIVLSVTETRRIASANSPVAKMPFANRLFRNIGIGTPKPGEPQTVPIPVETIQSVRCLGKTGD